MHYDRQNLLSILSKSLAKTLNLVLNYCKKTTTQKKKKIIIITTFSYCDDYLDEYKFLH